MRREFLAAERRVKVKHMGFWAFSDVFALSSSVYG